jgi:hypothetical protein
MCTVCPRRYIFTVVVTKLDPFTDGTLALTLFFMTLFFAVSASLAVIGFYIRIWWRRNEIYYQHISVSFRQGIFLSFGVCCILAFQSFRVLTWWDALLIGIAIVLVEVIALAKVSHDA